MAALESFAAWLSRDSADIHFTWEFRWFFLFFFLGGGGVGKGGEVDFGDFWIFWGLVLGDFRAGGLQGLGFEGFSGLGVQGSRDSS